jgi:hypothetical protein
MIRSLRPVPWLMLFASLLYAAPALAQEAQSQDESYFALELVLGVGGEAELEVEIPGLGDGTVDADLEASFGGALSWMSPLHRYFVLGAQLGLMSWTVEDADDRNLLTDLVLVPQGRLPVSDDLELTLSVPVGLVVDFWGGDEFSAAGVMADVSPGFGFEIGFLLGVRYAVSSSVGLLARLGYVMHSFTHEAEVETPVGSASEDFGISLGQPRVQLGVSF